MKLDPADFIRNFTQANKPVFKTFRLAHWEAATRGTPSALARARAAHEMYQRFLVDPHLFEAVGHIRAASPADALVARQAELVFLLLSRHQQPESAIGCTTQLESEIRAVFLNHRPVLEGRSLSDNELESILQTTDDADLANKAWAAAKQVGGRVAGRIRRLAHARNAAARAQGYRDHFQRSLLLSEIDERSLFDILAQLAHQTDAPFSRLKEQIDAQQAARFGIAPSQLRPWHYGDCFFQSARQNHQNELDRLLAPLDPVRLASRCLADFDMHVDDVLARSDLFERPCKQQHAFCMHIDREGDIRILTNLRPNWRWNQTLLHELGHAAYEKYLDPALPWLLRTPSHLMCSEALANLIMSRMADERWLYSMLHLTAAEAARHAGEARRQRRIKRLVFMRWCLVMIEFERRLYADPDQDLNAVWWDLVERYQRLQRPEGRNCADWAAKFHIALVPVYYHNYALGYLITAQLEAILKKMGGGRIDYATAGPWLIENYIRPGARFNWSTHVAVATAEPLNPAYLLQDLAKAPADYAGNPPGAASSTNRRHGISC